MDESMNFGNIGFANVSSEGAAPVTEPVTEPPKTEGQKAIELMAGVKEAQAEAERKKREEEQAIEDFKKANSKKKKSNFERDADNFSQIDFGPLKKYLDDDDITDISYSNNGQLWLKSLEKGVYRAEQQDVDNELIEKIAFQCSNVMGKTFNMAHPFLDSESAELRMNFVHESIARNGIAVVFRKTPAKIRLEKNKILKEKYIQLSIHDFLINCVKGHCNIIVCGETGSGKTELVKYLASNTAENEKLITIEDTLELHLDRIYPHRDIVAMKTNNIASYSDVLVTCMRQNPKWILLSEVRSAEAVTAVRNSISSGHYILSTIHADKAESIPHRMYSLLESNIDVQQFLKTIYRYVQIGVFVRGRYSSVEKRFVREIAGVCEFFVDDDNEPKFNNIYLKNVAGEEFYTEPTKHIKGYLEGQGIDINNLFGEKKASLAEANKANGVTSDVKEADGNLVHIDGTTGATSVVPPTDPVEEIKEEIKEEVIEEPIEKPIAEEETTPPENTSVVEEAVETTPPEIPKIDTSTVEDVLVINSDEVTEPVETTVEPEVQVEETVEPLVEEKIEITEEPVVEPVETVAEPVVAAEPQVPVATVTVPENVAMPAIQPPVQAQQVTVQPVQAVQPVVPAVQVAQPVVPAVQEPVQVTATAVTQQPVQPVVANQVNQLMNQITQTQVQPQVQVQQPVQQQVLAAQPQVQAQVAVQPQVQTAQPVAVASPAVGAPAAPAKQNKFIF